MLSRRNFLANLAAAPLLGRSRRQPNILFILADDLGYGDLGCYGQKVMRTPNIDRLAAEGMRFTQFYAGSTVCAPSRCALMTGLHTGHCHVRGNARVPLRPEDRTVAELLKKAGYATGIVGKWGLGEPGTTGIPNRKGFDEWFGYLNQQHAHNYFPDYLWKNEERYAIAANQDGRKGEYSQDLFTREAQSFLTRHRSHPFFLYLAYTIPHANNELKNEGMEVPNDAPYSNQPWPQQEKNFAAMVNRLDTDVGKAMGLLKKLKLDRNTLVLFSSDNGPHREGGQDPAFFHSSGPLRGIKRDLYEGGIRVPMIARWPGKIKAGSTSDHVGSFWDFLPTAAEIVGVEPLPETDGISFLPALLGKPQRTHEYLYWEFHERGFSQAVRTGDWKAVRAGSAKNAIELYDLRNDLGERNDVAAQHTAVVAKIEEILRTAHVDSSEFPIRERAPAPAERTVGSLQSQTPL